MRDRRFVAVHRGGPLIKEHHILLMRWARCCSGHVMKLYNGPLDKRLKAALIIAEGWENGVSKAGEAMKASVKAHEAARSLTDGPSKAVARSIGQAVATAHMADHSMGAAFYALRAVKFSGLSIDEERRWQNEQLPEEIRELVITGMRMKEERFRL